MSNLPLVSVLMITGDPAMSAAAIQSTNSFLAQTWPNKELLVVNTSGVKLPATSCVTEIRLRPDAVSSPAVVLQDMVQGEWWFNWPDDCWFAPDYIQRHMQYAHRSKVNVTTGAFGVLLPSAERFRLTLHDACLFSCFRDGRRLPHLDGPACAASLTDRRVVPAVALKFFREAIQHA